MYLSHPGKAIFTSKGIVICYEDNVTRLEIALLVEPFGSVNKCGSEELNPVLPELVSYGSYQMVASFERYIPGLPSTGIGCCSSAKEQTVGCQDIYLGVQIWQQANGSLIDEISCLCTHSEDLWDWQSLRVYSEVQSPFCSFHKGFYCALMPWAVSWTNYPFQAMLRSKFCSSFVDLPACSQYLGSWITVDPLWPPSDAHKSG